MSIGSTTTAEFQLRLILCRRRSRDCTAGHRSQARVAREAYRDFGKGSGHPARLSFGDCFAYALAKVTGEPLLFKGDDFAHTDQTRE